MDNDICVDSIDIIKRDLGLILDDIYQIQGLINQNYVIFSNIGRFDKIPINCIYKKSSSNILYSLIEYNISKSQFNSDDLLKMIGYTLSINDLLLGTLDFVFVSNSNIDDLSNKYIGHFEIIFSKIEKNNIFRYSLNKFDTYPGNEKIIYLLTSHLSDINII